MTLHAKASGEWKDVRAAYARVGGLWRSLEAISVKTGGNIRSVPLWPEQQQIVGDDIDNDNYGFSVAADGDTVVIGAEDVLTGSTGSAQGAAYVFVRSGGSWTQEAKLTASDATGGYDFGTSVAIEGDTILVGSPGVEVSGNDRAGAVYVFERSNGVWNQEQKVVIDSPSAFENVGTIVDISGDSMIVGAGSGSGNGAYVFTKSGGSWVQQQKISSVSTSVAIDGDTAIVSDDNAGSDFEGRAYVYQRSAGTWSLQQELVPAAGDTYASAFGISVDVYGDVAVVGDSQDQEFGGGAIHVFERSGTTWSLLSKIPPPESTFTELGRSVAISKNTIFAGATGVSNGRAYTFVIDDTGPVLQTKFEPPVAGGNDYGFSVDIGGGTVVIGMPPEDLAFVS